MFGRTLYLSLRRFASLNPWVNFEFGKLNPTISLAKHPETPVLIFRHQLCKLSSPPLRASKPPAFSCIFSFADVCVGVSNADNPCCGFQCYRGMTHPQHLWKNHIHDFVRWPSLGFPFRGRKCITVCCEVLQCHVRLSSTLSLVAVLVLARQPKWPQ